MSSNFGTDAHLDSAFFVAEPAAPESKTTEPPKAAATPMDNFESSDKAGPPGQEAALASV